MGVVGEVNGYLERTAPWREAKAGHEIRIATILYTACEALRLVSVLLQPVLPERMASCGGAWAVQPPVRLGAAALSAGGQCVEATHSGQRRFRSTPMPLSRAACAYAGLRRFHPLRRRSLASRLYLAKPGFQRKDARKQGRKGLLRTGMRRPGGLSCCTGQQMPMDGLLPQWVIQWCLTTRSNCRILSQDARDTRYTRATKCKETSVPSITYQGKLPPPGEFQKSLAEAMANANPVDDLIELANGLWQFEEQYQLPSAEFYSAYQAGTLDDELQHCIQWAATYETFVKTKRKLESALMRAVVQPETLEQAV